MTRRQIKVINSGGCWELEERVNAFLRTLKPSDVIDVQHDWDKYVHIAFIQYVKHDDEPQSDMKGSVTP